MKLTKIISGGQTGVDQTALMVARDLGLQTGGWAPKGWRTEAGPAPWLADYGLVEAGDWRYDVRTALNVRDSDLTVWIGQHSPGYYSTRKAAVNHRKSFFDNPSPTTLKALFESASVINFAGNRASVNPAAIQQCGALIRIVFDELASEAASKLLKEGR